METAVCAVDFSAGADVYPVVAAALAGKTVAVLVNNVGVMLPWPKYYEEVTQEEIWSHINVNMASVACMMKLVSGDNMASVA